MSQGSTGNVIAALVSFFIPGLGQLIQGRVLAALGFFVLSGLLWIFSSAGSGTSSPRSTPRSGSRRAKGRSVS
jgi:TM2 domain-containing membrane protein YozV